MDQAQAPPRGEPRSGTAIATAVTGLRAAVFEGTLRPGEPVREEEWAANLGTSRTPIREAIARLAAEGLLVKRGRQAFVFQPSLPDLIEVYEIRLPLELLATSLATRLATPASITKQTKRLSALRNADDFREWFSAHERFHMGIFEMSGRSRLVDLIRSLRMQSEPYVRLAAHADAKFRARSMHDHRAMVTALRRRDEAAMQRVVEDHLNATCDELRRLLANNETHESLLFAPFATPVGSPWNDVDDEALAARVTS